MLTKFLPHFALGLATAIVVHLPFRAIARTPLTKAQIEKLHNIVQFIPKENFNKRPARQLDIITPGDGVSTGRSSLADLRFNDGSLARLGEQAVFKFVPKERNFQLSNGTVLLLIPPGPGKTQVKTPNAVAAIRGSALFIRYNSETDTTVVGALTDSGIEVFNENGSQNQVLEAGQLMVVVEGQFQGLYEFDLKSFYETSNLVKDLNLTKVNNQIPDPALADVQAEITAALVKQSPITGKGVIENPSFLRNSSNQQRQPNGDLINKDNSADTNSRNNGSVESFIQQGEVILQIQKDKINQNNPGKSDDVPGGGNNNNPGNSGNNNNGGNGQSDGVPGGGNNNNPGNSDKENSNENN